MPDMRAVSALAAFCPSMLLLLLACSSDSTLQDTQLVRTRQATHAWASPSNVMNSCLQRTVAMWQACAGQWAQGTCQLECAKDLAHVALQHW